MSCDAERITGLVDGALDETSRAVVEQHLAGCTRCREQTDFEHALRKRLRGLPGPDPGQRLELAVRRRIRQAGRARRARWLLPLAASLAALALWARGSAPLVAWELARDHAHCFGFERLPAEVWGSDPDRIGAWFQAQGRRLPSLPASAGGLDLVGARICPLLDGSRVAHLYYVGENRRLSIFVLAREVRLRGAYSRPARGASVLLTRLGGQTVGLVSERPGDVEAFKHALTTTVAWDASY